MKKDLRFKKSLCFLCSVLIASTALFGCSSTNVSSSSTASNGNTSSTGSGKVSDKPVTISMLYADNSAYPYNVDWPALKEMTKETNVTLDIQVVPDSDYTTKAQLMMNSGTMPDIITKTPTNSGTAQDMAMNGKLLAYSDYFSQMPNFEAFMKSNNLTDELNSNKLLDGKIYEVPQHVNAMKLATEQWFVRKDVFDSLGLSIPTTWDDLYNDALLIKQKYPNTYPIQNMFGSGNLYSMIAPSFGTQAGWGAGPSNFMYDSSSSKWIFAPTTEQYKQFLTFVNKLYANGVLDKEFSTMDSTVTEKNCETNKGFITAMWFGSESTYNTNGKSSDAKMNWVPVQPFAGPTGLHQLGNAPQLTSWMISPASVKDKPYFNTLLKFIDWMYSTEGMNLFTWGIQGTTYTNDNGTKKFMDGVWTGDQNKLSAKYGVCNNSLTFVYPKDFLQDTLTRDEIKIVNDQANDFNNYFAKRQPLLVMGSDDKDTEQLYSTALNDYVTQMTDEFVMGKVPLSDWNDFVSQCNSKGADKLAELYNNAYQKQKS